jgi:hypothetical protein
MPGGKPVRLVPGEIPIFAPVTTVFPAFVTVDEPSTAKFAAVPKLSLLQPE